MGVLFHCILSLVMNLYQRAIVIAAVIANRSLCDARGQAHYINVISRSAWSGAGGLADFFTADVTGMPSEELGSTRDAGSVSGYQVSTSR